MLGGSHTARASAECMERGGGRALRTYGRWLYPGFDVDWNTLGRARLHSVCQVERSLWAVCDSGLAVRCREGSVEKANTAGPETTWTVLPDVQRTLHWK